jgi:hypothetical protein
VEQLTSPDEVIDPGFERARTLFKAMQPDIGKAYRRDVAARRAQYLEAIAVWAKNVGAPELVPQALTIPVTLFFGLEGTKWEHKVTEVHRQKHAELRRKIWGY